jgi:pilus assembly protein CpaB
MESSGRLVILLVAGVIVAFAAIAIRNRMSDEPTTPGQGVPRALIALRDIPLGTIIQGSADIGWQELAPDAPKNPELLMEGSARIEDFSGAVVRRPLRAGEMLTASAVTRAGEGGFMSAVLEPGMRAVSIAVNATSGNAGFISPGDRVDLIVTHHMKTTSRESSGNEAVVSETFVRNVRVLAVDQMLDNPENKAILAKTVTVEVNPRQAEQISVASEMGKIAVALRSLAASKPAEAKKEEGGPVELTPPTNEEARVMTDLYGNQTPDPQGANYTRDSDVSQLLDRNTIVPRIRVIRGNQTENVEFY